MKKEKEVKNIPRHKLYATAETLFVESGLPCNVIAEQLGVSEKTLSKWRNDRKWEEQRNAILMAPNKIRQLLIDEVKSISEGNKPSIDSDALSKISKTLQYFDGKVSLAVIIAVFKEFDNYMSEIDNRTAVLFTEHHKQFIAHRAKSDSLK